MSEHLEGTSLSASNQTGIRSKKNHCHYPAVRQPRTFSDPCLFILKDWNFSNWQGLFKNSTPLEEIPHTSPSMYLRNYCYQVALYIHAAVSPEPTFEKKAFDFFPMSCGFFSFSIRRRVTRQQASQLAQNHLVCAV